MFAQLCREHGYANVRRTAQYCGNTGEAADCVGLPGIHIEVKNVEHLNVSNAMAQAVRDSRDRAIPIVAHKKNREGWLITMRADDWFKLYEDWRKSTCQESNLK